MTTPPPSPWDFGWTQLLTIAGMVITIVIAWGGFKSFGRWKREKIEERKIETAIKALAFAHKSKFIFDNIRSGMAYDYEWKDMPVSPGDDDSKRNQRGPFFAIMKRLEANKDYFQNAWELQAECTALFGPEIEDTFLLFHKARREIEVSAEMLYRDPEPTHRSKENLDFWNQMRADVWKGYGKLAKDGDKVGKKLTDFQTQIESLCRPIVKKGYKAGFFS